MNRKEFDLVKDQAQFLIDVVMLIPESFDLRLSSDQVLIGKLGVYEMQGQRAETALESQPEVETFSLQFPSKNSLVIICTKGRHSEKLELIFDRETHQISDSTHFEDNQLVEPHGLGISLPSLYGADLYLKRLIYHLDDVIKWGVELNPLESHNYLSN